MSDPTAGERLIRDERQRQIAEEGYTPEHDREHGGFALSQAAYCYKAHGLLPPGAVPDQWPWEREAWKPRDPISNLVRAGALYLAAAELNYFGAADAAHRCAELIDACRTRLSATPDAGDASEPLDDHEYGGLPWDGNEPRMRAALNALVASREAAAATRARAEALREAAEAWWARDDIPSRFEAWKWLRDRADSLAPDTAGDSDV